MCVDIWIKFNTREPKKLGRIWYT